MTSTFESVAGFRVVCSNRPGSDFIFIKSDPTGTHPDATEADIQAFFQARMEDHCTATVSPLRIAIWNPALKEEYDALAAQIEAKEAELASLRQQKQIADMTRVRPPLPSV